MIENFQQRGPGGFSLVELMIVVAIMAILATIAAPSISEYLRRAKGRDVARSIANSVRYARDQATSRGEVVFTEIEPGGQNGLGEVRVVRITPSSTGGGDGAAPGSQGADATNFFGSSNVDTPRTCKEADIGISQGTFVKETVYTYSLAEKEPDMAIRGTDPSPGNLMTLCAMPDGRIGNVRGLSFSPSESSCTDQEFRIWAALDGADLSSAEFGSKGLTACVNDGAPGTSAAEARQKQRDSRDLVNLWMITVSYNGSVDATQ